MLAQQKLTSLVGPDDRQGVELYTQEGESIFGRVTGVQFK